MPPKTQSQILTDFYEFDTWEYYMLRIKLPEHDVDYSKTIMEAFTDFPRVIISREVCENEVEFHYHGMIGQRLKDNCKSIKEIRNIIKTVFGIKGNKQYMLKLAVTPRQAAAYTIKEDGYIYKGFTDEMMQTLKMISYKKFNKTKFGIALTELESAYYASRMTKKGFYQAYVELRFQYGQNFPPPNVVYYLIRVYAKKDEKFKEDIIDRAWDKIQESFGFF